MKTKKNLIRKYVENCLLPLHEYYSSTGTIPIYSTANGNIFGKSNGSNLIFSFVKAEVIWMETQVGLTTKHKYIHPPFFLYNWYVYRFVFVFFSLHLLLIPIFQFFSAVFTSCSHNAIPLCYQMQNGIQSIAHHIIFNFSSPILLFVLAISVAVVCLLCVLWLLPSVSMSRCLQHGCFGGHGMGFGSRFSMMCIYDSNVDWIAQCTESIAIVTTSSYVVQLSAVG